MDLALNNLQRLTCHKTQPTNQPIYLMLIIYKQLSYLPTPPLGQDMTQSQFLSGV